MKNKFMAKALLALAAVGITTTGLAASADASTDNGYGPREKKPVAINYNIVEYNDGTFGYGPRPEVKKPQVKKPTVKPQGQTLAQAEAALEAKLAKAKILVAEFDQKRTVKAHRAAQRAVNLLPNAQQVKEDKKILQERIDSILKQKLVK